MKAWGIVSRDSGTYWCSTVVSYCFRAIGPSGRSGDFQPHRRHTNRAPYLIGSVNLTFKRIVLLGQQFIPDIPCIPSIGPGPGRYNTSGLSLYLEK